ncbi:MAG TPA: hypothetical protein VGR50_01370 [Terriglobales bacterium]|nr:hypothetical protein [Terriglobales bacterium]
MLRAAKEEMISAEGVLSLAAALGSSQNRSQGKMQLAKNSRPGVRRKNLAPHPGNEPCNSTTVLGMRASLALEGSRKRIQSLNRYAYVGNNPLASVDPLGLWSDCTTGCRHQGGYNYDGLALMSDLLAASRQAAADAASNASLIWVPHNGIGVTVTVADGDFAGQQIGSSLTDLPGYWVLNVNAPSDPNGSEPTLIAGGLPPDASGPFNAAKWAARNFMKRLTSSNRPYEPKPPEQIDPTKGFIDEQAKEIMKAVGEALAGIAEGSTEVMAPFVFVNPIQIRMQMQMMQQTQQMD